MPAGLPLAAVRFVSFEAFAWADRRFPTSPTFIGRLLAVRPVVGAAEVRPVCYARSRWRRHRKSRRVGCADAATDRGPGEETMILDGVTVLVLAILVLLLMWAVVLAGSQFFGPR